MTQITLDRTTVMLVEHLQEHLKAEPQEPNSDMPLSMQAEYAEHHHNWSRRVEALRLLIGVRLVNLALDQL